MTEPLDARGVAIAPGDTVIYGFGVGRSVAMAEAVVLGDRIVEGPNTVTHHANGAQSVSLTPSGRVRLRVVRRSYAFGEKPVVDVAPDRLVVLKTNSEWCPRPCLPPSPKPTQAEENRQRLWNLAEAYTADLRATEVPDRYYYEGHTLSQFHARAAQSLAEVREKLKAIDDAEG